MSELLETLVRRGVVTTDPEKATECCGLPRDEDGFCTYREGHPIYVAAGEGVAGQEAREELRWKLDDSVLMHTGRSVGDIASGRVLDDLWPLIQEVGRA